MWRMRNGKEPEPITIEKGEIVRVYFDVVPGHGVG